MNPLAIDRSRVAADWHARGYSCDIWTDPPGQVWADFVYDVDELVRPIEGALELTLQGETLRPAVGEEVFIPAGVSHTVRNIGATRNRGITATGDDPEGLA